MERAVKRMSLIVVQIFAVAVVRVLESTNPDYAKDVLYSPTDVNNILLPELPFDQSPITV